MNLLMIIVLLLLVIIAVLVYRWYIAKIKIIVNEWDSNDIKDIEPVNTKKLDLGDSTNYTFSIWIYMTKWSVSEKPKYLVQRVSDEDIAQNSVVDIESETDVAKSAFGDRICKTSWAASSRYICNRSLTGHLDFLSVGS